MEKKTVGRFIPFFLASALAVSGIGCRDIISPENTVGPLEGSWQGETEIMTPFSYSLVLGDTLGVIRGHGSMEINDGNHYCDLAVFGQRTDKNFSMAIGCVGYVAASYVGQVNTDTTMTGTLTMYCHNTEGNLANTCSADFTMHRADSLDAVVKE